MVNNTTQVDSTTGKTKRSKPLIEKRRRTRINNCLSQLKKLVLQATGRNSESALNSKLEKADILEMTVQYLETIRKEQHQNQATNKTTTMSQYQSGYTLCTNQAFRYLELSNRHGVNIPSSCGVQGQVNCQSVDKMCGTQTLSKDGIQHRLSNHLNLLQNSFGSNSAYTSTNNHPQNNLQSSSSAYTCTTTGNRFQNSFSAVSPLYTGTPNCTMYTNSSYTASRSAAGSQQGVQFSSEQANRNCTNVCGSTNETQISNEQTNRNSPTMCKMDVDEALESSSEKRTMDIDEDINIQNNNVQPNNCHDVHSEPVWRPW